jgi:lysophospholipase L1-like esterase
MAGIFATHWLAAVPDEWLWWLAGVVASLFALGTGIGAWVQRHALRLLLSAAICCATIPLIDVLLRTVDSPRATLRQWPTLPTANVHYANVDFFGWHFGDLASMTGERRHREIRRIRYQTDAAGFRNSPPPDDAPFDLVVLGDSFSVGTGTSQAEIFANQLARQANLKVLNLSISASGPWAQFMYLRDQIPKRNIRQGAPLIWVLYTGNDLIDPYGPLEDPEIPWADAVTAQQIEAANFRRLSPLGQALHQLRSPGTNQHLVTEVSLPSDPQPLLFYKLNVPVADWSPDDVRNRAEFPFLERTVAAVKAFANERSFPVRMFILPCKEEIYGWLLEGKEPWSVRRQKSSFAVAVERLAAANHIECVDLKPGLFAAAEREFQQGQLLWWHDDTHINPAGHAAVANLLREAIHPATSPAASSDIDPRPQLSGRPSDAVTR